MPLQHNPGAYYRSSRELRLLVPCVLLPLSAPGTSLVTPNSMPTIYPNLTIKYVKIN